jgi:PAS domain S-box-containing protein
MQVKDNLVAGAIALFFIVVALALIPYHVRIIPNSLPISAVYALKEHFLLLVAVGSFSLTGIISAVLYRVVRQRYRDYHLLVKSEEKYRRVVHNAGVGIAVTQDSLLKYANPRLSDMFGYPIEESLPRPFINYIHPAYRKATLAGYPDVIEDNEPSNPFITRINDNRREARWVETNGVVIDWEGRPAILHFLRDITEEKKAKEALVQSEQLYRSLVENLNDVVFILDDRGFITYISPVVESLSGFTTQQLIGQDFRRFIYPDDLKEMEESFLGNIGRDYFSHEFRVFDGRGAVRHVRASSRVTVKGGMPVRVNGIVTDISDRKRAEDALIQSEKRYRELVENLNDIIFVLDGEGNFKFINQVVEKITGYKPEELIDRNYREFVTEESYDMVEKLSEEQPACRNFETFEVELYDKKADIRVIECRMTPIWGNDRAVEFHVIGRDVTEKREMTCRLIQAEKLSSLGTILSGVAHELNNPLSAILGNAQLLARKELPPNISAKLTVIENESKRSTKIVGGLLAFARGNKPERTMISVNDVIRDSCQLMEYELRVNNSTLLMDLGRDIPGTSLDPSQIQQVFINLITNAHHALLEKGGGSLSIRSHHRENEILIEFIDNGPGIAPENLKRIFLPFFTTKESGRGTGLGLSIVSGIIREHGGRIEVESEPGKGAIFTVVLPVVKNEQPRENPEMVVTQAPGGRGFILVVDDEKSIRDFMAEVLAGGGYIVMTAEDGNKAMELIGSQEFDAVVSNMKMPGQSGEDLYLSIREKDPNLADRLIISTGDILNEKTRNFLRRTGNRFIEKPFEIDKLLAVVDQAVGDKGGSATINPSPA